MDLGENFERATILSQYDSGRTWRKTLFQPQHVQEPTAPGMLSVVGRVFRVESSADSLAITAFHLLAGNRLMDDNNMVYINHAEATPGGSILALREAMVEREVDGSLSSKTTLLFEQHRRPDNTHDLETFVETLFEDLSASTPLQSYDPARLEAESLSVFRDRKR